MSESEATSCSESSSPMGYIEIMSTTQNDDEVASEMTEKNLDS